MPSDELNVKLLPVFGAKSPVAAVANNGKHVVSEDSSATVIAVGVPAAGSRRRKLCPPARQSPLQRTRRHPAVRSRGDAGRDLAVLIRAGKPFSPT